MYVTLQHKKNIPRQATSASLIFSSWSVTISSTVAPFVTKVCFDKTPSPQKEGLRVLRRCHEEHITINVTCRGDTIAVD